VSWNVLNDFLLLQTPRLATGDPALLRLSGDFSRLCSNFRGLLLPWTLCNCSLLCVFRHMVLCLRQTNFCESQSQVIIGVNTGETQGYCDILLYLSYFYIYLNCVILLVAQALVSINNWWRLYTTNNTVVTRNRISGPSSCWTIIM
jgi:hypothetical protein